MDNWSFRDSFIWQNTYPECGNTKQSPINIDTNVLQTCNTLCDFSLYYKNSKCYVNYKNNNIRLKYSSGSYFKYQDMLYELTEISIHTPSLHSIDSEKYDLEICLIHKLGGNNSSSNGVMLCILFEMGPHYGKPEQFINQIINSIPIEPIDYDKEVEVSEDWGANMLIPENKSFYLYEGSLPFPPCTEKYSVFVFENIGKISKTNIDIFKQNLGTNNRRIQQLNNRVVFYKSKIKTKKTEQLLKSSTNKYLKCNKVIAPEPEIANTTTIQTQAPIDVGIAKETKKKIYDYSLAIICLLLFILAYYFVIYLFKYYKAQKLLMIFAGRRMISKDTLIRWKRCSVNTEKIDIKSKLGGPK